MVKSGALVLLISAMLMLSTSCGRTPSPEPALRTPDEFFPSDVGALWQFAGWGNEYAPFTRETTHLSGDRLQIQDQTGGTTLGLVLRVTNDEATIVYRIEEHYSRESLLDRPENTSVTLLKSPLRTGQSWQTDGSERIVLQIGLEIVVRAGLFTDVMQIKVTRPDSDWIMYEYYAPGVGLIRRDNVAGEYVVISELESYALEHPTR